MDIYIPQEHEIGGRGLESKCVLWWAANAFEGLDRSEQLTTEDMTLCYTAPVESPRAAVIRALARELDTDITVWGGAVHAGHIGIRNDCAAPAERVRAYRAAIEACGHTPRDGR